MAEASHTAAELQQLLADARANFLQIPGVVGVGFGLKEQAGRHTPTMGWRVYVREKKPLNAITEAERIPGAFAGFPTDVLKVREVRKMAECEDSNSYSPLLMGATITNLLPDSATGNVEVGSIGFFATYNGETDPKENVVLVSAHHVLTAKNAPAKADIYQPYREDAAGVSHIKENPEHRHEKLGQIHAFGMITGNPYDYSDGAGSKLYFVDAASAKLNLNISSWCGVQCGIKFKAELRPPGINGTAAIAGYERVSAADLLAHSLMDPYKVYKLGARTGFTEGWIVDCNASLVAEGASYDNAIEIIALSANCRGDMMFADQGDSGSAILNANGKMIGIVHGGNTTHTLGCHIHPVIDLLGVTPITAATPHQYASIRSDGEGRIAMDGLGDLKARFAEMPNGAAFLGALEEHRWELSKLVNQVRPVTVAWHRHQGPGFLNRLMANSRNPEILIPAEIAGISLTQLLQAMLPVLHEHGSPGLRSALNTWSESILSNANGLTSLHNLVSQFNPAHSHE